MALASKIAISENYGGKPLTTADER